jgi:hypothetical protein
VAVLVVKVETIALAVVLVALLLGQYFLTVLQQLQ